MYTRQLLASLSRSDTADYNRDVSVIKELEKLGLIKRKWVQDKKSYRWYKYNYITELGLKILEALEG